jgi:ABC-type multidrug transport system fused ATPase/permease subunit
MGATERVSFLRFQEGNMYCINCGALNKDNAKFCANCDESLSDVQIEESLARPQVLSDVSYLNKVNFFQTLFDFSFNHFIGVRIMKFLFGISIFAAFLMALLFVIAGFQASKAFGFFSLFIGAPLIFLLVVIYSRVLLEMMLVVSRMSDYMANLGVANTEEKSQSRDSIQWNV